MKNKILFILDRAHGENTIDKQSPDGSFKEWKYSQRVVDAVAKGLRQLSIPYAINVEGDKEIGLTNRVINANKLSEGVKHPILLSFHNNAGGGTGNELFIRESMPIQSVEVANIFAQRLMSDFPEIRWRREYPKLFKRANFTVIAGSAKANPNYIGLLIEFLFMDNEKDLTFLKDDSIFARYIDSIIYSIVEICIHYGYGNFLKEK